MGGGGGSGGRVRRQENENYVTRKISVQVENKLQVITNFKSVDVRITHALGV